MRRFRKDTKIKLGSISKLPHLSMVAFVLIFASVGVYVIHSSFAATTNCSSVTYSAPSGATNNITYTFDKSYVCGQFANGDWFVVPDTPTGAVNITSISPAVTTGRNGVAVNPIDKVWNTPQPWDNRIDKYQAPAISFPYAAHKDESVVKAVSMSSCASTTCLQFAAVLTVLSTAPASPSTTFRPAYTGTVKTLYSAANLHMDRLQRLASSCCSNKISNSAAASRAHYLRLDYSPDPVGGYYMIPADSVGNGRAWGGDKMMYDTEALGWLNLDNVCGQTTCTAQQDLTAKLPVAIDYTQQGIDIWGSDSQGGAGWFRGGGGNGAGALMLYVFAATMLDDTQMNSDLSSIDAGNFWETSSFYRGNNGKALWGQPTGSESEYWNEFLATSPTTRTIRDPYGYIDGGAVPGGWYQALVSDSTSYLSLLMHVMPSLQAKWPTVNDNANVISEYGDRWHTHGASTTSDPCKAKSGTYGTNYGPNGSGGCVTGSGRAPGTYAASGAGCQATSTGGYDGYKDCTAQRVSGFMEQMYSSYRNATITSSGASTYYVSLTGSDSNNCTSASSACATIDGAWDKCSPGDTIIIKAGDYTSKGSQIINGDKASPGCTVTGENGTTVGPLETDGQYLTLQNVTVNAGNSHGSGGWGVGASNITLKNVNLHGPYVSVSISGVSNIQWLGGELGQHGVVGGKRQVCSGGAGDPEPVQIGDADHILIEGVTFHPQDSDITPVPCSSNGYHLEIIRLDGGTSFFTLRKSVFDPESKANGVVGTGTASIFITTPNAGTDLPHDLTFVNNFFGNANAPSGTFDIHENVTNCQNITVAYNTMLNGDGAWQCTTFNTLKFIGNVGPRAASPCTGVYTKNVWQDNVDYASGALGSFYVCGTDKVVIGQRYGTEALGLASDGFHLASNSPAINAAESGGYCTSTLGSIDFDGDTRPQGGACDAGADEFTASSSGGGGTTKAGDFNGDGVVNIYDLGIFLSKWNTSTTAQDLNSDGVVNIFDLGIFLSHYGT